MRWGRAWLLVLAAVVAAQETAEDRKVGRLLADAKKRIDGAKDQWKTFVFQGDDMETEALEALVSDYERAIDLYTDVLEIREEPGADSAILQLARRVTQLRFVIMGREMRERRAKEKPTLEPQEEKAPDAPPPKPAEPPKPVPEQAEEKEAPEERAPAPPVLPDLEETSAQRRRGIQAARTFLMNTYFASRKFPSLITRCVVCNGTGRRPTTQLDKRRHVITVACPACHEKGAHLEIAAARKGFWLVMSPLYRADHVNRTRWETDLAQWQEDPGAVPNFLTSLRIEDVDYHGLWAEVTWTEKGTTPDKQRFTQKRKEKLIRAGRQWFFYDPQFDRDFFRPDDAPDDAK